MVSNYEILFRLFLAAVLGAVVGLEREVHGRPAGIRTRQCLAGLYRSGYSYCRFSST